MKLSYQWLNCYLEKVLPVNELIEKLTSAGLEVDSVEAVAPEFTGVVVGEIQEIKKHPDADKLNVCQVNVGGNELLTIVCGAPNIYVGMKAPVAIIGAKLPGNFKIKKSKLRGQPSFGMMCSGTEIGLEQAVDGLMDLPKEAPIGQNIRDYLNLNDQIIDVDLTPNRADCLSIYGVAREVSALTGMQLISHPIEKTIITIDQVVKIKNEAPEACPRYFSRVIRNVNTQVKTPLWMKERLRRSAIRPVSLVVDVTNFVLLELGQPMHAFDADKIKGDIVIRSASLGEKITLLDENEVIVKSNTLVIADDDKAIALAGIMGGVATSVTDETRNIILESAYFEPKKIAGRARQYGLHTDSSHRFERGVDPLLCEDAIEYAAKIIVDIAGGEIGRTCKADHYINKLAPITVSLAKINSILGTKFEAGYVEKILTALDMKLEKSNSEDQDVIWQVTAPSYRFDMAIEEDLIEEVGRVYGYQNLPMTLPVMKLTAADATEQKINVNRIKSLMVDRGYSEVINYSFIEPKLDSLFSEQAGLALHNPISQDMSVMRQSLIPGIVSSFKTNLNRQQVRIRLFEEGSCFQPEDKLATEKSYIAGLAFGGTNPLNWQEKSVIDFYSVKADVDAVLRLNKQPIVYQACEDLLWLHPGQSAYIYQNNEKIGVIGLLHPSVMKAMKIKGKSPIVFELLTSKIVDKQLARFTGVSKYPSIARDIAIIVDQDIVVQKIVDTINKLDISILTQIDVFDVYQGDNLPENKKNIALNLTFQDNQKTLTDEMINVAIDRILVSLSEHAGATLRD